MESIRSLYILQLDIRAEGAVQSHASRFDELIDVVDPVDCVVGSIVRRQALKAGANFRVAHVFVFNSKGELLIQRIAAGLRHGGLWGASVAGYLTAGEPYAEAAERKLKEELGLQLPLTLVGKTSMLDGACTKFICLYEAVHDGSSVPDANQISALAYLPLATLVRECRTGIRECTPTFCHLLDYYQAHKAGP
jgi:isopentenyl-diphosphate delta-isomerase